MIELSDVEFRYDKNGFGLRISDLQVESGQCVALAGPSGCGKTTLLNLLSGIVSPEQGRIRVAGRDVSSFNESARRSFRLGAIGFVFQQFELLEYLNVRENILIPFCLNPSLPLTRDAELEAEKLCDSIGLKSLTERLPNRLSHGERQRVAIARALVTRPQLLFADEPTGNLDPTSRDRIVDLLFHEARSRGTTLLVATHDHTLLDRFDRVIDFAQPGLSGIELLQPAFTTAAVASDGHSGAES